MNFLLALIFQGSINDALFNKINNRFYLQPIVNIAINILLKTIKHNTYGHQSNTELIARIGLKVSQIIKVNRGEKRRETAKKR